ncbi:MAG: alpha/beta hydrolase [Chitinophagaceae bacterium]|nr:MAG: alpha/beta hydrolase [Chitinophagaceae bacterium]
MKKSFESDGHRINYSIYGSGSPVMLVHGFGEKGDVWSNQLTALESGYQVIVPELPGCGGSSFIPDMSMEGMARVLKGIFDAEGIRAGQASLLGHSMGGYITLAFMEQWPEFPRSFGLVHSVCYADNDEKRETRKKGIAFIRKHGGFAFLQNSSPNLFSQQTRDSDPGMVKNFVNSLSDQQDQALVDFYEAMMARPDRSNVLKDSKVPVLFILGRHDTAVPIKDGLRQTGLPDLSYIHVLENSGHMGMLEEKEKTNEYISGFLSST